ncbi:MAG: trehalose-phosphatase [Nocardioides sp.]|nr:trehalose-phosphatase [Nocardioides sp.]
MEFLTADGEQQYTALVRAGGRLVVGLDFDGTLAPIVEDPARAHIHADGPAVLEELSERVRAIAVITGRPARQVLALGGLEEVGAAIGDRGRELFVLGQYGNERWSSTRRRILTPAPPRGLAAFERDLPELLRRHDAEAAHVEDKGLAVAVHTRRLPDGRAVFDRLLPALTGLAARHGLAVEPGRHVVEVRAPGMHKGGAVRGLAQELEAGAFLFVGDDLGDVAAFEAVAELREGGMPGLLVCSGSEEERALMDLADAVVPGPEGVLSFLTALSADLAEAAG